MAGGFYPNWVSGASTWVIESTVDTRGIQFPTAASDLVFSYSYNFQSEWECSWCGSINIISKHLSCPHCGGPRKVLR